MTGMIILHKTRQAACKVLGAAKTAAGYKAAVSDAKKPLGLMEPRAVRGGAMPDMARAWITHKGPALRSLFALVRCQGPRAPASHQAADSETPRGMHVVHHPIRARHAWQLFLGLLQRRHQVRGLTGGPDGPSHRARGHRPRVDQDAGAVAAVRMVASLAPARLGRCGGRFALQHVPAGFFIAADHQTAVLGGLERLGVPLAERVGLGLTGFLRALQPVCPLVGLAIHVVQETPEAGAADRLGMESVEQGGDDRIERPPRARAILGLRQGAGDGEDVDPRGGAHGAGTPWTHGLVQPRDAPVEVPPSPRACRAVVTAQIAADFQVGRGSEISRPEDNVGA